MARMVGLRPKSASQQKPEFFPPGQAARAWPKALVRHQRSALMDLHDAHQTAATQPQRGVANAVRSAVHKFPGGGIVVVGIPHQANDLQTQTIELDGNAVVGPALHTTAAKPLHDGAGLIGEMPRVGINAAAVLDTVAPGEHFVRAGFELVVDDNAAMAEQTRRPGGSDAWPSWA